MEPSNNQISISANSTSVKTPGKNIIAETFYEELKEHKFFGIIVTKAVNIASEKLKNKIFEIIKILNSTSINSYNLKKLVFDGLPDDIPSLRSLVWKMLLGYLSMNVNDWEESIDRKRNEYNEMKKKMFEKLDLERLRKSEGVKKVKSEVLDSDRKGSGCSNSQNNSQCSTPQNTNNKKTLKKKLINDHPLSMGQDSRWKSYFEDIELIEEIDKDVRRTRTHMHFFFMPSKSNTQIISNEQITELADKKRNEPGNPVEKILSKNSFESNADVMCRILFIYGKKYPEIRYIQGMNEMLAPIFYTFSNDQNPYFYTNLEADSYICFEHLMNEIRDIFIRSKDNTETGIQTRIKNLNLILKMVDKDIYNHFISERVEIQYFVFRWYTLFLTQEFEMPDILRLWDSILSEENKFEFLNMVCVAIIKMKRNEILQSDFAGIMLSLQNLEKLDIEKVIFTAENIRIDLYKASD